MKKKISVKISLQQCLQFQNEIATFKTMIEKKNTLYSILVIKLSVRRTEIALTCVNVYVVEYNFL